MTTDSSTHQQQYARLADPFGAVVGHVTDWDAASPCAGWSARDVLGHVVQTQREFLGSHDVDLGDAPDLADPAAAWRQHDRDVRSALADDTIGEREFDGYFGRTTVGETLTTFYGFDLMVHRWDLARAAGRDERFTDDELGALETSVEGFGDQLYAEGICKPGVTAPEGADRQQRLLARLGRSS